MGRHCRHALHHGDEPTAVDSPAASAVHLPTAECASRPWPIEPQAKAKNAKDARKCKRNKLRKDPLHNGAPYYPQAELSPVSFFLATFLFYFAPLR